MHCDDKAGELERCCSEDAKINPMNTLRKSAIASVVILLLLAFLFHVQCLPSRNSSGRVPFLSREGNAFKFPQLPSLNLKDRARDLKWTFRSRHRDWFPYLSAVPLAMSNIWNACWSCLISAEWSCAQTRRRLTASFPTKAKVLKPAPNLQSAGNTAITNLHLRQWRKDNEELFKEISSLDPALRRLLIRKKWPSPNVATLPSNWTLARSCNGLLPPEAYVGSTDGVVRRVKDLMKEGVRALVVFPKNGLGNSLKSYQSSFVFSLLTGRQLVLFKGGPRGQVFKLVCWAFHCGSDTITDKSVKGKSAFSKFWHTFGKNKLVPSRDKNASTILSSAHPVMWVSWPSHFDWYWDDQPALKQCVLDTLGCLHDWCVKTVAINHLLRDGPTEALGIVVESTVVGQQAQGSAVRLPPGSGLNLWFDLTIHARLIDQSIENPHYNCTDSFCRGEQQAMADLYEKSSFWECVGQFIERDLTAGSTAVNIFLATDSELLRPLFVRKLARFGTVYHSTAAPRHTSRYRGAPSLFPTLASFYLLGRASKSISMAERESSFLVSSVQLGNGTCSKFMGGDAPSCRFRVIHEP